MPHIVHDLQHQPQCLSERHPAAARRARLWREQYAGVNQRCLCAYANEEISHEARDGKVCRQRLFVIMLLGSPTLPSSKVRRFVGSDGQIYQWARRTQPNQEWTVRFTLRMI
jgi:hypothetical protein